MLLSILGEKSERKIIFIHANQDEKTHAFREVIDVLESTHKNLITHYRYSEDVPDGMTRNSKDSEGFVDAQLVKSLLPTLDADYYFCGPKRFMVNIYHDLLKLGIPASQTHFEFFGPREELEKINS
jgi:nitric oxide dioxygenase